MNKHYLLFLLSIVTSSACFAQTDIPNTPNGGPMGQGSWLRFLSGSGNTNSTSIQEFFGLNFIGRDDQPIKINNASLLVGYSSNGATFGSGNLFVNGKVGIGTTNANSSLDVNGGALIGGNNLDGQNLSFLANSSKVLFGWNRSAGWGEVDLIANQGAGSMGGFRFYNYRNDNLELLLMSINGDGNVGIGTIDPQAKLGVKGLIRAKEIKVEESNWPDYVFKPTYKLPSLTTVKAYIDKNKHLPDMPSETDVAKDGVNLGKMNKLLLKKVEELTLYLIDKDRQLSKEKAINQQQQQSISILNRRLSKLESKTK